MEYLISIPMFKTPVAISQTMGILLYFVPMLFCLTFYFVRTARNYVGDRKQRELAETDKGIHYYPRDTIGSIIGRVLVSIIPIANIWAAMFDLAPSVFGKAFSWIGKVFNQPLVPKKKN